MPCEEGPIDGMYYDFMNRIGRVLADAIRTINPNYGFALFVFKLGESREGDHINYISNAERKSMLIALKEFIARNEGNFKDRPLYNKNIV